MANKRVLEVVLVGDESSLRSALGRATGSTKKFGDDTERVHARVRRTFAGLTLSAAKMGAGIAAGYASITGAKAAIKTTEELAHTTLKLHNNLGLSIKTASEWGAVARSRDIDGKALSQSFAILSKQVYAANAGSKAAVQTFKDLGVSQEALKSGDFNRIIGETADGFKKLAPGTEKTALATKAFGRGWQTIFPLVRGGSDAMREQLDLADKYGATFSGHTAASLEEFIQKQREAKLASEGLQIAFGTEVAPALTKVIGVFTEFSAQLRDGTGAGGEVKDAVLGIKGAIEVAAAAVGGFSVTFEDFIHGNSAVMHVVRDVWGGIQKQVEGTLTILKGVIEVFSGILTGDFGRAWEGVKDIFSGALKAILGGLQASTAPFRVAAGALIHAIVGGIKDLIGEVADAGSWVVHTVAGGIRDRVDSALSAGRFVADKVRDGIKGAGEFLGDAANWILDKLTGFVHGIGSGFKDIGSFMVDKIGDGLKGGINAIVGFVNKIIGVINKIPGVEIGKIASVATDEQGGVDLSGGTLEGLARGGRVGKPMVMVGEEAPAHPEFVIATNPAYRQRNLGLLAQAASAIGAPMPGFALGGIIGDLPGVGGLPDWMKGTGRFVLDKATDFIKDKIAGLVGGAVGAIGDLLDGGANKLERVVNMVRMANAIDAKGYPYVYGGGHGSFNGPYDCSGAVSAILHAGGYLNSPVSTDGLKVFGESGDGNVVTIGVRGSSGRNAHTMMQIGNRFFESGSGHGAQWVNGWSGNFPIHRHPPGLAKGGVFDPTDPRSPFFVGYGLASGGHITRDGWSVVGERGPELAHFKRGTDVFSNAQSRQMGGVTVNGPLIGHAEIKRPVDVERAVARLAFKLG